MLQIWCKFAAKICILVKTTEDSDLRAFCCHCFLTPCEIELLSYNRNLVTVYEWYICFNVATYTYFTIFFLSITFLNFMNNYSYRFLFSRKQIAFLMLFIVVIWKFPSNLDVVIYIEEKKILINHIVLCDE